MEIDHHCVECGEEKVHKKIGMMPTFFTQDSHDDMWEKVALCVECGSLSPLPVNTDDIRNAHERYLTYLVEENIITEQEKQEALE